MPRPHSTAWAARAIRDRICSCAPTRSAGRPKLCPPGHALRALQAALEREGLSRKMVKDYRGRVERCFRFAAGHALVPSAVADALRHVGHLMPGQTTAPEPTRVEADADVERVLSHLHPDPMRWQGLAAMVRAARLTSMRPGEVCALRGDQVDRTRTPWLYRPPKKTLHLDKDRKVLIRPKGRELLRPLLAAAGGGGDVFTFPRYPGEGVVRMSEQFLRLRLAEACVAAGVPVFTPNQLRHARGTEVQRRYEDDAAVAALGNTPEVARQVYTDDPADAVAKRIARELG